MPENVPPIVPEEPVAPDPQPDPPPVPKPKRFTGANDIAN